MWQSVLGADGDKKEENKKSKSKTNPSGGPANPPTEGYAGKFTSFL